MGCGGLEVVRATEYDKSQALIHAPASNLLGERRQSWGRGAKRRRASETFCADLVLSFSGDMEVGLESDHSVSTGPVPLRRLMVLLRAAETQRED